MSPTTYLKGTPVIDWLRANQGDWHFKGDSSNKYWHIEEVGIGQFKCYWNYINKPSKIMTADEAFHECSGLITYQYEWNCISKIEIGLNPLTAWIGL